MNYQKIYNQIIERAKTRNLEGYKEKHHIIPKCLGGNNKKENLVELTAREHFLCHLLLCRIYSNHLGLSSAMWFLINASRKYQNRYIPSARMYEQLKKEYSRLQSKNMRGKKQSKETCLKKSKSHLGKKKSKEHSKNISKAKTGKGNHMYGIRGKNNPRSKPIQQLDKNNNLIKEWENGLIASEKLNINYIAINNCLNNKTKTSGGFIWNYI